MKLPQPLLDVQHYFRSGLGNPEGRIAAPVGGWFSRRDGGPGSAFYVKEVGNGPTGWATIGGITTTSAVSLQNSTTPNMSVVLDGSGFGFGDATYDSAFDPAGGVVTTPPPGFGLSFVLDGMTPQITATEAGCWHVSAVFLPTAGELGLYAASFQGSAGGWTYANSVDYQSGSAEMRVQVGGPIILDVAETFTAHLVIDLGTPSGTYSPSIAAVNIVRIG